MKNITNPFKYGEIFSNEYFCNRKTEIKRLHNAFRDAQSIVLISPRRWGKSSLVERAVNTYPGGLVTIYIDCFGINSIDEFYSTLLTRVLKATSSKMQQASDRLGRFAKALVPHVKFSVGEFDEVMISLDLPKSKLDISDCLDLAQKIAIDSKKRIAVCIDEFQKVQEWKDGDSALEKMRSHWQKHKNVSYCLYGSKRHIMQTMFSDSSQPFYRFGETIFLTKIERDEWVNFLLTLFKATGKKINNEVAGQLVDLVECHAYFVQYLARICWNNAKEVVDEKILNGSFIEMLSDQEPLFRQITSTLTAYQINYLRAVVAGETQLTSSRVLHEYGLGSPGNVSRNSKLFEDMEVLDYSDPNRIIFCDPYFVPLFKKAFTSV